MIIGVLVCLSGPWFMPTTTRIEVKPEQVVSRSYPEFFAWMYDNPEVEGWAGIEICDGMGMNSFRAEYFQYAENASVNSLTDEI